MVDGTRIISKSLGLDIGGHFKMFSIICTRMREVIWEERKKKWNTIKCVLSSSGFPVSLLPPIYFVACCVIVTFIVD